MSKPEEPRNPDCGGRAWDFRALAPVEQHIPTDLRPELEQLLDGSADPRAAVMRLGSFCSAHPAELRQLAGLPSGLRSLVAVFSASNFLSEEVQQHPGLLPGILESGQLNAVRTTAEMEARLETRLGPGAAGLTPLPLAEFRRQEILRILLRDALGLGTLPEVTEELSNLADAILDASYHRLKTELVRRHGHPRLEDGSECGFSIVALGKLGGRELNYSSDIDLMFVFEGPGKTDGAQPLTNQEFYKKLSNRLTGLLSAYSPEGMTYRVDLRLRPDGRLGEVCISRQGAQKYYETRSRDWELQMLIKARVAAGEARPGEGLLDWVQPRIYSTSTDFSVIESMSETRERITERMNSRRTLAGVDVKLARGGIRDIEFLVQCLQRMHGGHDAWIRSSATLPALVRLRDKQLLAAPEFSHLNAAYQFLRHLEHRLQFADDRQTHTLPQDPAQLALVARRMPAGLLGEEPSGEALLRVLNAHLEGVCEIYSRVVRAGYAASSVAPQPEPPARSVMRVIDEQAPALAAAADRARLGRSQTAFEHFLEHAVGRPEWLRALNADHVLSGYLLDIFAHSPYFAEQLMRQPEYFEEIRAMRAAGATTAPFADVMTLLDDAAEVRRHFLRQMFRLQVESICLQTPVFATLQRTSQLADSAIAACYRLAVEQTLASHPPASPLSAPRQQMMVIALGRLGMLEFDLGSDADLVFVIPDAELPELHFWTRVAEKLVATLASYSGEGAMFVVDTRLCPNGKGGALVQSEGAYRDYFARTAEAWEGVAYMKTRAVAGDEERATAFLADLQKIDWRRYGQSMRSRQQLRRMRMRIEKELGEANPLKTASGGYYDIDFALMYLRLKGAGMFFKVLNTPERIEVLEQMGHLEPNDAQFLRDAATFYRAVDHGLRLISGHTEGSLPALEWQNRILTSLVKRWVPEHLCDQPLPVELVQIQERTREIFDRLFSDGP